MNVLHMLYELRTYVFEQIQINIVDKQAYTSHVILPLEVFRNRIYIRYYTLMDKRNIYLHNCVDKSKYIATYQRRANSTHVVIF